MSLHRLIVCKRAGISTRNAGVAIRYRWQSSVSSSRGGRMLLRVVGATGLVAGAAGGVVVYANYNPIFKNQVEDKIPGFSAVADKAADLWVDVLNYFRPKPGIPVKDTKDNSQLVYEYSKAKNKARLEEVLKGESSLPHVKREPVKDSGSKPEEKLAKDSSNIVEKPEDRKVTSGKLKGDEDEGTDDKGRQSKNEASATKDDDVAMLDTKEADPSTLSESSERTSPDPSPSPVARPTEVAASTSPTVIVGSSASKDVPPELPTSQFPSKDVPVPSLELSSSGIPAENKNVGNINQNVTTEGSKSVETTTEPPVTRDPRLTDPTKSGDVLEEAYEKFVADSHRVKKAHQQLRRAWEDLYMKVTAPATEVEGAEQQIAEAKAVCLNSSKQLKAAAAVYDASGKNLKELIQHAPDEGFITKASSIATEMKLKVAEVSLGLVLVKEAIANAKVADAYRSVIQDSRNELQKELKAAVSVIDPKEKDSLIMALNKNLEILQRKLKESETEHARKLTLALEVQRRSLEQLAEEKLECSLKESEAKYQHQLTKEVNEVSSSYHGMLREQLRLEHESHVHQREVSLRQLADKLSVLWQAEMNERLFSQETHYQLELARAHARLAGVESMVDTVADAGEKTIQLQMLRSSCDGLVGCLQNINSDQDKTSRFILGEDLQSFREVAHEDPFIVTILDSVPAQAVCGTGIQSEAGLCMRFDKVRRVCRSIALVPPEGAGPFTYILSYIQSVFTFRVGLPEVPQDAELEKLDTYDILRLAERRMRKSDLEGVVDCMAFLKGEPKRVAKDWLEDARAYLETRQAIQLLQTYMSARTLTSNSK